jgi:hypothetical protein
MILAVLAMMLGQVVAMPSVSSSLTDASRQHSALTQTALEQDVLGVPCHHHGNTQGPVCCFSGDCPMLTLALPVVPWSALPTVFRLLAYLHDAIPSPDGTGDAPLVPPPRLLV